MKNIKIFSRLLAALLCLGMLASAIACNKNSEEPATDGSTQTTAAPTTGEQEHPDDPTTDKVQVALTVTDQDGVAVKDVTVKLTFDEEKFFEVITDANGKASAEVIAGACKVTFECPEGYLGFSQTITVSQKENVFALQILNNIPNGTKDRPFVLNEASKTLEIPANTTHYCMISNSTRIMIIQNANVKVVWGGTTYTPDATGKLEVLFEAVENSREPFVFEVINTSAVTNSTVISFEAIPGTEGNPHKIEVLGEIVSTEVQKGEIVYYKWVATQDMTLALTSLSQMGALKMQNNTKSMATEETSGMSSTVELEVNAGDEVIIYVASGDSSDVNTVEFKLSIAQK